VKREIVRIVKYLAVGFCNSAAFAVVTWIGHRAGLYHMLATAFGYLALLTVSFFLNSRFTFAVGFARWRTTLPRFLLVTIILLVAAETIQYLLIEEAGLREILGILGGMAVYMTTSYLLIRNWAFAPARAVKVR
jgi:putative flippase GtrA